MSETTMLEFSQLIKEKLPDLKPRRRLNLIEDIFGRAVSQARMALYPGRSPDFTEREKWDKIELKADGIVRDIISDSAKLTEAVKQFEIHEPAMNNLRNTVADLDRDDRKGLRRGR